MTIKFNKIRNVIFSYIGECRLYQSLLRFNSAKYTGMAMESTVNAVLDDLRAQVRNKRELVQLQGLEGLVIKDMQKDYAFMI